MVNSKYIDMLTDFGFKRIFGDKELLMAFLNAFFESEGKVITSVRNINKEMTPVNKDDRTIFYDVLCKTSKGESFIIEMQHKPQDTFRERSIYYMSRAIDDQGRGKKKWNYKLCPVYGIFITNFHLKDVQLPDTPITEVVLKNRKTNDIFSDKIRMFFLDLLAFDKKTEEECETKLDNWIYSIKNSGKMKTAPRMAKTSPVFDKLYSRAELAAMTTRQRNQYELSLKHYWDMLSDRETTRNRIKKERAEAREEGVAEGLAKGRAEGLAERLSIAKSLLEMGMSIEQVSLATRLTKEQIHDSM